MRGSDETYTREISIRPHIAEPSRDEIFFKVKISRFTVVMGRGCVGRSQTSRTHFQEANILPKNGVNRVLTGCEWYNKPKIACTYTVQDIRSIFIELCDMHEADCIH